MKPTEAAVKTFEPTSNGIYVEFVSDGNGGTKKVVGISCRDQDLQPELEELARDILKFIESR